MNYDRPINYFNDYMDYRFNRKHYGSLARSILNRVELDRSRPFVSAFPRTSYSDYYYRHAELDRMFPIPCNRRSGGQKDDPIYRAKPDLDLGFSRSKPDLDLGNYRTKPDLDLGGNGMSSSSSYSAYKTAAESAADGIGGGTWTSRRYPYSRTMTELADDLRQNQQIRSTFEYDRSSSVAPLYTPRVWDSSLDSDFSLADSRYMRARSLESDRERSSSVARAVSRARSLERDVPLYTRPFVYPYYSYYTAPSYFDYSPLSYRDSNYDLITYGPKAYYPPYTPYATYRHTYNPVVKRLNPEWDSYKPYEYRWRQFRYVLDPEQASHGRKELEANRMAKAKELDKWFERRDQRQQERRKDEDFIRKRREQRDADMGLKSHVRVARASDTLGASPYPSRTYTPTLTSREPRPQSAYRSAAEAMHTTAEERHTPRMARHPRDEDEEDLSVDLDRTPASSVFKMQEPKITLDTTISSPYEEDDDSTLRPATKTPPSTPNPEPELEQEAPASPEVAPQEPEAPVPEPAVSLEPPRKAMKPEKAAKLAKAKKLKNPEIPAEPVQDVETASNKAEESVQDSIKPAAYEELSGNWSQPPAKASGGPDVSSLETNVVSIEFKDVEPNDSSKEVAEEEVEEELCAEKTVEPVESNKSSNEEPEVEASNDEALQREEEEAFEELVRANVEAVLEEEENGSADNKDDFSSMPETEEVNVAPESEQAAKEDEPPNENTGVEDASAVEGDATHESENHSSENGTSFFESTGEDTDTVLKAKSDLAADQENGNNTNGDSNASSPRMLVAKSTGQTLVEERDLGEDECVRLEYQVEEIQMDGDAEEE